MDHIKSFNENWKDNLDNFLHGKKGKKEEYLSQFKKSYEERSKSENILVESLYFIEFEGQDDRRFLGAMESVLILNDYMDGGKPFDYEEREQKFLFMKFKTKETYKELILRKSKKFLSDKGVL